MKIRWLALLLIYPCLAFAATTVTRYVTPGCANNGDGSAASCAASNGGAGAYNSIRNAGIDIDADYSSFVSSDIIMRLEVGAGTATDTNRFNFTGVITDATRYLDVVCDPDYRLITNWGDSAASISMENVRITGCWIEHLNSSLGVLDVRSGAGGDLRVIGNTLVGGATSFGYYQFASGTTLRFINNFMSNPASFGLRLNSPANFTAIIYNNTCYVGTGTIACYVFDGDGSNDARYVKNNIANGCTSGACWGGGATWTTTVTAANITSDTDSPDGASFQNKTCTFVDTANDNLHLDSGDTNCKDVGTDLSADGQYAFSTDIDGDTRSGSWDVGADELAGSSTPTFSVFEAIGAL